MSKDKTKVYLYTRVSTLIQVDGYSLDAQKSKMKAFCEYKGKNLPDSISFRRRVI